ncbi:MAG TPA: membrane protein insertase YidC [Chthoniobacterales bacterium]|nr:membrane protein insertase YidC [Chthoniobacterales bacterium]
MDRQAWIAVTLCVIGLVAWYAYSASHLPPPRPANVPAPTPALADNHPASSPGATAATTTGSASPLPAASPTPSPAATAAPFVEKSEVLANADVELHLTNRGGAITEAVLLNHTLDNGNRVALNAPDRIPIGAIVQQPDASALSEYTIAKQPDGSVLFEQKTPESVNVRKRFFFPPTTEKKDNFVAEMEVDFRNDGAQAYNNPGYFVTLGSTRPIHPNDMTSYTRLAWCVNGKANGIDVNWFPAQTYPIIGVEKREAKPFYREKVNNADWAGMTNQFFTDLVTPLNAKAVELWARPFDIKRADGPNLLGIEGAMGMPGFQLQPGQSMSQRFQLYTGPKLYGRLAKLQHEEAEIMNFGWFKLVSQFLLNFMNLINGWIGNYGWSIVLLTACVKGVLWPLQNKANKSMRRMSALAPKMQELKEKYKDDPTRMNQEVMKLYKEHGVNPVGGCLPMMIQIPIFFGLFSMLGQAAELRNARFLWVHDLSQPDTLAHLPGLGWPINILPLIMGATNLWLMRMTPKTGDTTQQKVMMFMPLIFLFFCYNFAAALALYYTTQNLFTILQLYQNRKQPVPVLEKVAPAGKKKGRR